MYQVWLYYGEFLAMGAWGLLLTLVRRILFGRLCRDASLEGGGKGRMQRAMTLKFEKSFEVRVGICDIPVFVRKYLCQERRFGVRLTRWRRLPERWTGLILCVGFIEAMALRALGYPGGFCLNRFLAAATAAAMVLAAAFFLEADSLWEQAGVCLLDYVSNTLYPRQTHVYEKFREEEDGREKAPAVPAEEKKTPKREFHLEREEEQLFQEVLSDFLGART